jgi:hypothetical protein
MTRIISLLSLALLALAPVIATAQPDGGLQERERRGNVLQIAPDAPERYVVVKGDTLWGISSRYLSSPWNWPELWGMNREQVNNPHLIYPGDVLVLDRRAGRLYVERDGRVVDPAARAAAKGVDRLSPRAYAIDRQQAIPSIPADVLQPFLTAPLVVDAAELTGSPRVIGAQENRVVLGSGDRVFVSGIAGGEQREWHLYRPGEALRDPDTQEILGHEATYLGDATLQRAGEPALLLIQRAKLEIGQGDRLITGRQPLTTTYLPRPAPRGFSGKVASIHGRGTIGGQYSVITLNRGQRDGLETGHVVALERGGRLVPVRDHGSGYREVALPQDRYALAFVFRTFERIAYALVMHATVQVSVGDVASAP